MTHQTTKTQVYQNANIRNRDYETLTALAQHLKSKADGTGKIRVKLVDLLHEAIEDLAAKKGGV
jgi:hypothetical protein